MVRRFPSHGKTSWNRNEIVMNKLALSLDRVVPIFAVCGIPRVWVRPIAQVVVMFNTLESQLFCDT